MKARFILKTLSVTALVIVFSTACQKDDLLRIDNSSVGTVNVDPFLVQQITIQVSPNVLNLLNNGEVVTIHTDIPYSQVVGSSVEMNGITIQSWKSDNQGYFVAKFNSTSVKGLPNLIIGGYNLLTVSGSKVDGSTFTGSSSILVLNNVPTGSGRN